MPPMSGSGARRPRLTGLLLLALAVAAPRAAFAAAVLRQEHHGEQHRAEGLLAQLLPSHALGRWVRALASRRLLQSALYCPVTGLDAFYKSKNDPGATDPIELNPANTAIWSCRTWFGVYALLEDEFTNGGSVVRANYSYAGQVTESSTEFCLQWGADGSPSQLSSSGTALFQFLTTFMDKPYLSPPSYRGPAGVRIALDDSNTCLESWTAVGPTSQCAGDTSRPWRLTNVNLLDIRASTSSCCDYGGCTSAGLQGYRPYLTAGSTPDDVSPSPSFNSSSSPSPSFNSSSPPFEFNATSPSPSPEFSEPSPSPDAPQPPSSPDYSPPPDYPQPPESPNLSPPSPDFSFSSPSPSFNFNSTFPPVNTSGNGSTSRPPPPPLFIGGAGSGGTTDDPPTTGTGNGVSRSTGASNSTGSSGSRGSPSYSSTGEVVGKWVGVACGIAVGAGVVMYVLAKCTRGREAGENSSQGAAAAAASLDDPGKAGGAGKANDGVSPDGVAIINMPGAGSWVHHPSGVPQPAWGAGSYTPDDPFIPDSSLGPMGSKYANRSNISGGVGSGGLYGTGVIGAGLQPLPESEPVSLGDTGVMITRGTSGAVTTTQGGVSVTQGSLTSTTSSGQVPSAAGSVISQRTASTMLADHMRIRYDDLRDFVQIGQGGFGNVFKCKWQGHQVVVKMLRSEVATDKLRAALVREALLMRELQHPAVARVYGVVDEAPHHALVMQLYKRGTLEEFMTLPATSLQYNSLPVRTRLRMAEQVADGMAYLHQRSPPIIHGDLKAANLLVDEDNIAITDFGLAVQLMTSGHGGAATGLEPERPAASGLSNLYSTLWTSPTLALSVFISPPEVLSNPNAPRSTATDVYAFGITLLQIMTGRMPYKGLTADMVINLVKSGKRPPVPESIPFGVRQLIEACWAQDPAARPSMPDVAQRIKVEMAAAANATLTGTMATTATRFFT